MNGLERYMGVIKGHQTDFLPRLPILMAFAAQYIGSNYGAFASDYRVLAEANLKCSRDFGFDQLSAISDPYRETQGYGAEIEFVPDGVPRCKEPPLSQTKDLSLLKRPDPLNSTRMLDRIQAVKALKKAAEGRYSILGWVEGPAAEAADLRGVTHFLYDLADDPDFLNDLMARCVDTAIDFAAAQLDAGADTVGIGDAIVSQISPRMYETFVFPHQKRLVDAIHKAGGLVRLHICGNTTHLLRKISELDVDIMDLDWMVDMAEARRVLGPETVLAGNLNPVDDVQNGSPETIIARTQAIYQAVGNPYMVGAGCEIPAATPHANLKALCTPITYR